MLLKFCVEVHVLCGWNRISHVCVASESTTRWEWESPFGKFVIHPCEWFMWSMLSLWMVRKGVRTLWLCIEILKSIVVNWLLKSLHPSTTIILWIWVSEDIVEGQVCVCVFLLFHCKKPWEGKEDFQAKPCQSIKSKRNTRPHMLVGYTG